MALSVPEKPGTFTGNWEPLMKVHTLNAPAILRRDSVESQSGYLAPRCTSGSARASGPSPSSLARAPSAGRPMKSAT